MGLLTLTKSLYTMFLMVQVFVFVGNGGKIDVKWLRTNDRSPARRVVVAVWIVHLSRRDGLRENVPCFEFSLCVCPEPVLANGPFRF